MKWKISNKYLSKTSSIKFFRASGCNHSLTNKSMSFTTIRDHSMAIDLRTINGGVLCEGVSSLIKMHAPSCTHLLTCLLECSWYLISRHEWYTLSTLVSTIISKNEIEFVWWNKIPLTIH